MRLLTVLIVWCASVLTTAAQDEPEYRLEVGAGAGAATYLGDYNGNLTSGMQPWGALQAKYRMNPRMALTLSVGIGKLKGSSDDISTWYPATGNYSFDKQLTDIGIRYEYNFWAYGTGREYRGAHPLTPFITLGLGGTIHGSPEGGFAMNVPLGIGLKYKMATRLNLTAEWRVHFVPSDKLDGVKDPYGIASSGLFKNTDGYSVLQVSVTYDLWEKCKTCNNDRY